MSIPDLIRIHSYRHRHRHIVPIILSIVCIALLIFYMTSVSNPHQQQDTMLRMKLGMKVKSSSTLKPLPVVVATRFWGHTLNDLETLHTFLVRTLDYAQHVIVAINTEKDTIDTPHALARWDFPHVTTLPVTPWYGMSSALNALLLDAATRNHTYILYQSVEIKATREHIAVLLTELDDETICTGAYLAGAHQFQSGIHPVSGINIPWNTIALWHVPTLLRVGFLPVSDGLMPGSNARAGVEEMPVMALLQTIASQQEKMQTEINTPRSTVKLIRMRDPVIWEADFEKDETRRAWQQQKIATKISRGAAHVRALGVRASFVFHIIQDTHGGRGDTSNPNHAHAEHPS